MSTEKKNTMEDAFQEHAMMQNVQPMDPDFRSLLGAADGSGDNPKRFRSSDDEKDPLIQRSSDERSVEGDIDNTLIEKRAKLVVSRSGMNWCLTAYAIFVPLLAVVIFFQLGSWSIFFTAAMVCAGLLLLAAMILAMRTKKKVAVKAVLIIASFTCLVVISACVRNVIVLIRSGRALVWSVNQGIGEVYTVYHDTIDDSASQLRNLSDQFLNGEALGHVAGLLPNFSGVGSGHGALPDAVKRHEKFPIIPEHLGKLPANLAAHVRQHAFATVELSASNGSTDKRDAPGLSSGIEIGGRGLPGLNIGLQIKPSPNDWLTVPEWELPSFPEVKNTCHEDYLDPTSTYRKGVNIASQSMARFGLFCSFTHFNFFEMQKWPISCVDECGFDKNPDEFIGSASKDNRVAAVIASYERRGTEAPNPMERVKLCTALQTTTSCSIWNMWYLLVLPAISALWLLLFMCSCCMFIPGVYNASRVLRHMSK